MITLSKGNNIDLPILLESRMLVQAQSGGGKSWALRRILEQTAPHIQQLIIDPEGEFASLRERYDYVIAAPHDADAVASPKTANLLARRLLESGVSAVLDIYDLKAHERQLFVKRFLDALVNSPRKLWHPVIVVLDEAHIYAPQTGSSESTNSVIDIATRGRKRGQCLIAATQRLSKLHKDVAAELMNKLIGRTGLDVDVKRAADELGLTPRDAMTTLRDLAAGEFYCFGPAISRGVKRVMIGSVVTTHPRPGQRMMQAPPIPSARVRKQLSKLADLQIEAEEEARSIEQLKSQNIDLKRKITLAEKQTKIAGIPEKEVERRIQTAVTAAIEQTKTEALNSQVNKDIKIMAQRIIDLANTKPKQPVAPAKEVAIHSDEPPAAPPKRAINNAIPPAVEKRPLQQQEDNASNDISGPEQRILDAIAWMESIGVDTPEQPAVAFLAGYKYGGGAYNNPRGKLNGRGLVQYMAGGTIALTEAGRGLANIPDALVSSSELQERVLRRLRGPEQRLLKPLIESYPEPLSNDDLAEEAGYTPGAGAYNNPRGKLRSMGLIEYPSPGYVVAKSLLFPD